MSSDATITDDAAIARAAGLLQLASDATRAKILLRLAGGPMRLRDLTAAMGLGTVVPQLFKLRSAALVERHRGKGGSIYRLTPLGDAIAGMIGGLCLLDSQIAPGGTP